MYYVSFFQKKLGFPIEYRNVSGKSKNQYPVLREMPEPEMAFPILLKAEVVVVHRNEYKFQATMFTKGDAEQPVRRLINLKLEKHQDFRKERGQFG